MLSLKATAAGSIIAGGLALAAVWNCPCSERRPVLSRYLRAAVASR